MTGLVALDLPVVTVAPLLTPGHVGRDAVVIVEADSLVHTAPSVQANGRGWAAHRSLGHEILASVRSGH